MLSRLTESIKQHLDARAAQSIRPQSVFKTGMHQKSLLANVEFQVCKGAQFLSFSKWRRLGWDLTHNASRFLLPNKARSRCPARSVGPSGGRARTSPPLGASRQHMIFLICCSLFARMRCCLFLSCCVKCSEPAPTLQQRKCCLIYSVNRSQGMCFSGKQF